MGDGEGEEKKIGTVKPLCEILCMLLFGGLCVVGCSEWHRVPDGPVTQNALSPVSVPRCWFSFFSKVVQTEPS